MRPAPFDYVRCASGAQALEALAARPAAATVLAGGQSLLPQLHRRTRLAPLLLDVAHAPDLIGVTTRRGRVRVRAATPMADVERAVARSVPLLAAALALVASPAVRNRGTLGGSAAHADPAAEVPTVLVALEATITLASARGRRRVAAGAFFAGRFATLRRNDELLTEIELPALRAGEGDAWREVALRRGDLPLVGAGVRVALDGAGRLTGGRVGLGGAASRPQGFALPRWAAGQLPSPDLLDELASELVHGARFELLEHDVRASPAYRRRAARELIRDALAHAAAGAAAGTGTAA